MKVEADQLKPSDLRDSGWELRRWYCPECGAVIADDLLSPDSDWPVHEHDGRTVEFVGQSGWMRC